MHILRGCALDANACSGRMSVMLESSNHSHSTALGKVAELQLASELIQRGHKIAVPICDDHGVDLVVDYLLRVQVKSSSLHPMAVKGYSYQAFMWTKIRPLEVDVFALNGEGRWFFVPSRFFGDVTKTTVTYYEGMTRGKTKGIGGYENAWEVFGEGTNPRSRVQAA